MPLGVVFFDVDGTRAHCAAIGDSRSDLPLFAEAGLSIAFNASPAARAAADEVVDGPDLSAVIPLLAGRRFKME